MFHKCGLGFRECLTLDIGNGSLRIIPHVFNGILIRCVRWKRDEMDTVKQTTLLQGSADVLSERSLETSAPFCNISKIRYACPNTLSPLVPPPFYISAASRESALNGKPESQHEMFDNPESCFDPYYAN